MRSLFFRPALVLGMLSVSTAAFTQNATSFQINPQHTGATVFPDGLKLPLRQLWSRNMGGLVTYPLLVGDFVLISVGNVGSYGSVYYALDRTAGTTVWSQSIPGTYFTSLAAYDSGKVFVLNLNGILTSFKVETGKQLWHVQLPRAYTFAPPTASGGSIYINGSGALYAVKESDGSVIWSQNTAGGDSGAPTLSEDGIFLSSPCHADELDLVTGASRWNYSGGCDGGGGVTTAYYDQILFTSGLLADNSLEGNALLGHDGRFIGNLGNLESSLAEHTGIGDSYPPALQGGMAYFVGDIHGLVARTVPDLKVKWHFTGDNTLSPAAIVVNGQVIVASNAGHLYVLDGTTGQLEQTLSLPQSEIIDEGGVPPGLAAGNRVIAVPYLQTLTVYAGAH